VQDAIQCDIVELLQEKYTGRDILGSAGTAYAYKGPNWVLSFESFYILFSCVSPDNEDLELRKVYTHPPTAKTWILNQTPT
jgi:hypothetical protein